MIALIFATYVEAKPFLRKTGLDTTQNGAQTVFDLRPGKEIVVCICGMGPNAAAENTRILLDKYPVTSVINAGVAGALAEEMIPGMIFKITTVLKWPENQDSYQCRQGRWTNLQPASLATVEKPVFDPALRLNIADCADLVDMEGAFIASACRDKNIPFSAIKGITDQAGEGDRKTLHANLDKVSVAVADSIWKELFQ